MEVGNEYHLLYETYYTEEENVDLFIRVVPVPKNRLQLVGITSLYIS